MANTKLIFCGINESSLFELQVYANMNELCISIDMNPSQSDDLESFAYINFDKSTAIKLSREIRKQIAEMED